MELSLEQLTKVRTLTIVALFSDDDLMDALVLKGGNALEIGYGLNSRASIDVDVSMVKEFVDLGLEDLDAVAEKLDNALNKAFQVEGYKVFDVRMKQKPKQSGGGTPDFWSGYEANFKIIEFEKYAKYLGNPISLSAKAIGVNEGKKNVKIDFGRFEYCGSTISKEINGFDIQIYTPELIVFEKIRAICQQMPEYLVSINKDPLFGKPRPRDFYDIYTVLEHESIPELDFGAPENLAHLTECFAAKNVPIELIAEIKNTRKFHAQDETKLKDAILDKKAYQGFDYYFDYVMGILDKEVLPRVVSQGI